ncbi:hypothetical protein A3H75_02360 [Candidatus Uhrbacteria bacterium RIFCSPLOWO2_02_FULL_51_9]|uniref:Antitoxin n=1 Tax=Candidatus Uhrbacteria bacterium RIFCSPLOWO2_02_FULL_51_9 TaxID=1802410 RepID=A0A1F7VGA6_9BACT|nr:MAG: hypothetical protein A3H75_02360 [Candidatus Uhrbacteria bacterium RIFCSPLOWO2_02_FULL_51_9]
MVHIIGLKEVRANINRFVRGTQRGESYIVARKSKPLFRLGPLEEETWQEVIDFTTIKKGGVNIKEILKRL